MKVSLRNRITVQRKGAALDEYGQESGAWIDVATRIAADVRPVTGREKMRAMSQEATLTHTVCVRYQRLLDEPMTTDGWRVVFHSHKDRIFNIAASHTMEEESRWIIFDCAEGSVDGL